MPRTYSTVPITAGVGTTVDSVQTSLDADHRQIVVLGDPDTDANLQAVDASGHGLVTPGPSTLGAGLSTYFNNALLAAATSVKASAGKLHGWQFQNPNTSDAWVQMFDLATVGVTLGTTAPKKSIWVPAGGESDYAQPLGINHATAITIAATTTSNGLTAPITGLVVNVDYI